MSRSKGRLSPVRTQFNENSLPAKPKSYQKRNLAQMILNCFILGDTDGFPVVLGEKITVKNDTISFEDFNVGLLMNYIWEIKKDIISSKIDLWKVEIEETDKNIEKLKNTEINIRKEFRGTRLSTTKLAKNIFPDGPPDERIHIIIQPLTTDQGHTDVSRIIKNLGYLPRQSGRGGTLLNEREQSAYTAEGISLTDPDTNQRSDFVSHLAKSLEQKSVILVRAPPYSGKTSLAQLLENHLVNSSKKRVIRVSLLWGSLVGQRYEYNTFGDVWKQIVGVGWHEWVSQCRQISSILIIDEAQMIYRDINEADKSMRNTVDFWDTIKMCLQGSDLKVIMFAAYGYGINSAGLSTPVAIPLENNMGLAEIRFTYEELVEYTKCYCSINYGLSNDSYITSQFIGYIKNATAGHVGLVRHILHHTKNALQSKIRNGELTWKRIFVYMNSDEFSRTIDDCRAAHKLSNLSEVQMKKCQDVYTKGKIRYAETDDNKYLVKRGFFVVVTIDNNNYLCFAAPLIERSFFQQYYGREKRAETVPDSLYEFIVRIFTIMCEESREILSGSLGYGKDRRLLEQMWKKEFYRIGTRTLGDEYFLSCDAGAHFGSEGYIDFYVNGLDWGIELLREGVDMEEHKIRFDETTGEYKEIVKVANETAIVDIRRESKKVRELKEGFVHVSYSENYNAYMIECLGETTLKIKTKYS